MADTKQNQPEKKTIDYAKSILNRTLRILRRNASNNLDKSDQKTTTELKKSPEKTEQDPHYSMLLYNKLQRTLAFLQHNVPEDILKGLPDDIDISELDTDFRKFVFSVADSEKLLSEDQKMANYLIYDETYRSIYENVTADVSPFLKDQTDFDDIPLKKESIVPATSYGTTRTNDGILLGNPILSQDKTVDPLENQLIVDQQPVNQYDDPNFYQSQLVTPFDFNENQDGFALREFNPSMIDYEDDENRVVTHFKDQPLNHTYVPTDENLDNVSVNPTHILSDYDQKTYSNDIVEPIILQNPSLINFDQPLANPFDTPLYNQQQDRNQPNIDNEEIEIVTESYSTNDSSSDHVAQRTVHHSSFESPNFEEGLVQPQEAPVNHTRDIVKPSETDGAHIDDKTVDRVYKKPKKPDLEFDL